ncbi:MAG: Ig-like domain-containing protein, partial [Limisphaerales bacterium]
MKKLLKIILPCILCSTSFTMKAQDQPYLSISNDSPTSAQISWTNNVGTSYRLFFTPDLSVPLSLWTPLEDAFSGDANVSVDISTTNTPNGFFLVQIPTNGASPAVQIFSPTNNQVVSGTISVGVGAQIGAQIQGVNLYLDNALVGFIDSGGIQFDLDTTHFTNGLHTLYVGADDTANDETLSSTITLDFENSVRWLNAVSLFQSVVPVNVQSDIFPANWTVFVADGNGTIVRTFSGTTSDGNIQTNWDGNDNNGVSVPSQAAYTVTVAVTPSGSGNFSMMSASSLATDSGSFVISASPNRYGVMEYQVEEPAPDPMVTYSNLLKNYLQMPEAERIIFPPFWDLTDEPAAPTIKTLSAYD